MTVVAFGISHHSAPLDLRGRFAFAPERIGPLLTDLRQHVEAGMPHHGAHEVALLSTCNRTEIYWHAPEAGDALSLEPMFDWVARTSGVQASDLRTHCYGLVDRNAAQHVFRVASGIDSMVLGEPQILGQMKQAARMAGEAGVLGTTLHQLFQRSFTVAKDVRTNTDIGAHSISLAAAAVRLAERIFEDLGRTRVLFIGAGEMIELAATHFAARKPCNITIANRSPARAAQLAATFGAAQIGLSEVPDRLHEFDVVVSCTASTLPVIGLGAVKRALKQRRSSPMFIVDLAVPRDVEKEVHGLRNVFLYTLDDLAAVVDTGQRQRTAALQQAEAIVAAGADGFMQWLDQRTFVPLIQELNAQMDQWRAAELVRARRQLQSGADPEAVLESFGRGLPHKILHGAYAEMKADDPARRARAARAAHDMFLRRSGSDEAGAHPCTRPAAEPAA